MSNLHQIGVAQLMYMEDNGPTVSWWKRHPSAGWVSQFTWGGFIAPQPDPLFGQNIDYMKWGADERPLSKYLAPAATKWDKPEVYICPGDRTRGFGIISGGDYEVDPNDWYSSWMAAGNSYAVNWFWLKYYYTSFSFFANNGQKIRDAEADMMPQLVGGRASEFIVYYESLMHNIMQDATYSGGGVQRFGWHRRFSKHGVSFLDGHAENKFMDTRYPYGSDWTIWVKKGLPLYLQP